MSSYMVSNENLSRMAGYHGEILDAQIVWGQPFGG